MNPIYNNNRHTTPPSHNVVNYYPDSVESHFTNPNFFCSVDNSPDSIFTDNTSPSKSPGPLIKVHGPPLLPKIRCQDQTTEPSSSTVRRDRPIASTCSQAPPTLLTYTIQRPLVNRRAVSPPEGYEMGNPNFAHSSSPESTSAPSASLSSVSSSTSAINFGSAVNSPIALTAPQSSRRSSLAHVRTVSSSMVSNQGHVRSASNSSIDEAT